METHSPRHPTQERREEEEEEEEEGEASDSLDLCHDRTSSSRHHRRFHTEHTDDPREHSRSSFSLLPFPSRSFVRCAVVLLRPNFSRHVPPFPFNPTASFRSFPPTHRVLFVNSFVYFFSLSPFGEVFVLRCVVVVLVRFTRMLYSPTHSQPAQRRRESTDTM